MGYDPEPGAGRRKQWESVRKEAVDRFLKQSSQELLSLDMTVGDTGGMTLGGLLKDNSNNDPEALVLSQEMVTELQRIMLELNDREADGR